jgi:hypothetical protein
MKARAVRLPLAGIVRRRGAKEAGYEEAKKYFWHQMQHSSGVL